jgi:Protein of unknown function (DUF2958)
LTELDPEGGLAFGRCDLGMGEPELGDIPIYRRTLIIVETSASRSRRCVFNEGSSLFSAPLVPRTISRSIRNPLYDLYNDDRAFLEIPEIPRS